MSSEPNNSAPAGAEPRANRTPVPIWLVILFFILLYWAMIYFDTYGGWFSPQVYAPYRSTNELAEFQLPAPGSDLVNRGRALFNSPIGCAVCHQPDGMGKPGQFPPLAGSEWVQGPPNRLIRIPLCGLTGPITVHGAQFNNVMPPLGSTFKDDELAAILSYIRQSFGNNASEVSPEQVKAVRSQVSSHPSFTADELNKVQ